MKKLLFIFTTLLLFSCSSSSDDNNSSNYTFHPPTWIQGTWYNYAFNNTSNHIDESIVFLTNNIIKYDGTPKDNIGSVNYNEHYGGLVNTPNFNYTIKEETTSTKYVITYTYISNGLTSIIKNYYFKINSTTINFDTQDNPNSNFIVYSKIP